MGQQQTGQGFAMGLKEGTPLSIYFAHRKTLVNSTDSFRIFCAAVALLQVSIDSLRQESRFSPFERLYILDVDIMHYTSSTTCLENQNKL